MHVCRNLDALSISGMTRINELLWLQGECGGLGLMAKRGRVRTGECMEMIVGEKETCLM